MKTSMTNNNEYPGGVVLIYGPPKVGKTISLATALPLGPVLHISAPGEGNAAASLRDYPIHQVRLESYDDLMALEIVLLGRPGNWLGDPTDNQVSKLKRPVDPALINMAATQIGDTRFSTIALDGLVSWMSQIFGGHSIEIAGKDLGIGRYGDEAEMLKDHLAHIATYTGLKFFVLITQDDQVKDEAGGNVIMATHREPAWDGKAARKIIPPMCDFILPVFTAEELGKQFEGKTWEWEWDGTTETRNRYWGLKPMKGYWAGGRVPMSATLTGGVIQADFTRLYRRFYMTTQKETKVEVA